MSASIVKINGKPNSTDFVEYIMDSISDIYTLPTDCADGSIAYTANLQFVYLLKNGVWEHKGGGGGGISVESLNVNENREYTAPSGKAYSPVNVNVPNTYTAADEGKVVDNGALVAQASRNIAANGTYDTTTNDEVVVSVQPNLQIKTVTQNGTVTPD